MKQLSRLSFLLALVFGAAVAFGADAKPNFSGTWKLNVAKSEMGGAPVEALTLEVDHKDPVLTYTAKGTAAGQPFEETVTLTTDGKPARDGQGTVTVHWEGNVLLAEGADDWGKPSYTATLTLADDGKSFTRVLVVKGDNPQNRRELYEKQ